MFEDETIDIACPKCGFKNSLLVREFEQASEVHFVCPDCGVGVKIEASEFQQQLNQISNELENLTVEARQAREQSHAACVLFVRRSSAASSIPALTIASLETPTETFS